MAGVVGWGDTGPALSIPDATDGLQDAFHLSGTHDRAGVFARDCGADEACAAEAVAQVVLCTVATPLTCELSSCMRLGDAAGGAETLYVLTRGAATVAAASASAAGPPSGPQL